MRQKVKRRPLPGPGSVAGSVVGSVAGSVTGPAPAPSVVATADTIENFPHPVARPRHGPRELGTPPRANSMPPEVMATQPGFGGSPAQFHTPPPSSYGQDPHGYGEEQHDDMQFAQPEFLPQLPPTPRRLPAPQGSSPAAAYGHHSRGPSQAMLSHANSAPSVPTTDAGYGGGYEIHTDAPEPLPDLDYQHQHIRQRRNDVPPGWGNPYDDMRYDDQEDEMQSPPPPPPMHSHSAPVIPQHSPGHSPMNSRYSQMSTPPSARQQYVPNASPLQSIERGYSSPQHTPPRGHGARGRSIDDFTPSPPQMRTYDSSPSALGMSHSNMSSPGMRSPVSRAVPNRHSMADIYNTPPQRPHPLSQEVPRARSPMPPFAEQAEQAHFDPHYADREGAPIMMPRAISPAPPPGSDPNSERRSRSTYGIRHPVRAFETSDSSPLGSTNATAGSTPHRPTPMRKSVSPRPSPTDTVITPSSIPYGPDSYDIHNPSNGSPMASNHSAQNPYQIRPEPSGAPPREGPNGPIVGWDGREIDPSDHLPVDSWAPEPEKKSPTKTYGLGRDRDFGPRTQNGGGTRLSNDVVINFRRRSQVAPQQQQAPPPQPAPEPQPSSPARNRLYKKSPSPSPLHSAPLRERPNFNSTPPSMSVPDPYATQDYSRGFYDGSPGISGGDFSRYDYQKPAPALPPGAAGGWSEEAALSREIAGIDLGAPSGSTRRMPTMSSAAGTVIMSSGGGGGWQGVRSHRDRGFQ